MAKHLARAKQIGRVSFNTLVEVSALSEASGVLLRSSQQDNTPAQGTMQGGTTETDMHLFVNLVPPRSVYICVCVIGIEAGGGILWFRRRQHPPTDFPLTSLLHRMHPHWP